MPACITGVASPGCVVTLFQNPCQFGPAKALSYNGQKSRQMRSEKNCFGNGSNSHCAPVTRLTTGSTGRFDGYLWMPNLKLRSLACKDREAGPVVLFGSMVR